MYTRTFSTLGCAELTLDEAFALAHQHGVTHLELRALGGTLDLPAYFAANFGTPTKLAARLALTGVRVAMLDTSFKLIGGGACERAKLLEHLPWADALGVRWLRVFEGGVALDASALAEARDAIAWWQAERSTRGTAPELAVETHDLLFTADMIGRFFAAIPASGVRLLWDTHHTWKRGGEDPIATWRAIKPHVVHVHVKDSVSVPGQTHPFTYVLPGTGEFPMNALRDTLAAEFSGGVSLEWEKFWHPNLGPLDEALNAAKARTWW